MKLKLTLRAGIVGKDKVVEFYCDMPVYVKDNEAINSPTGIYFDKKKNLLVVVRNKHAPISQLVEDVDSKSSLVSVRI